VDSSHINATLYLDVQGPAIARQIPVGAEPVTIGRSSQNVLALADHMASRFHCVVERIEGGVHLRDLNSSNGTLLNGRRVTASPLTPGDVVRIGNTRITLVAQSNGNSGLPGEGFEMAPEPLAPDDLPPNLDSLTADDLAEPLSDADMVADDMSVDEVLPIDSPDEDALAPVASGPDPIQVLRTLVDSLPDKPFGERDIAMTNSRGQIVHPAGRDNRAEAGKDSVLIFRLLLLAASRSRATDLHFEPKNGEYLIRMRVDGLMVDVVRVSPDMGTRVSALVKVLSDIDLAQRNAIQEGHFSSRVPGSAEGKFRRIDYRVSFAPSVFGQKLVLRVLDTSNAPLHIGSLGLPKWMRQEVETAVKQDAGMLLVCGPTGSGKTTTLYALVRGCDVQRRNVVTIEDPVEIELPQVTQIPVDESQDKTFSNLLRSVLRQDPDVILIGEIRDTETARIAMQAAITGHLVYSTIHTRDTIGTIFRLLDLNVEPYLVAQALQLVLAQRLVRQLCQFCKSPVTPTRKQLQRMGPAGEGVSQLFIPYGCAKCLGTGFAGRRAFFELLRVSDTMRDLIARAPTLGQVQEALAGTPFKSLAHGGFQLAAQGLVSFDEIDKAVGRDSQTEA